MIRGLPERAVWMEGLAVVFAAYAGPNEFGSCHPGFSIEARPQCRVISERAPSEIPRANEEENGKERGRGGPLATLYVCVF
jgi:hypothetical protein